MSVIQSIPLPTALDTNVTQSVSLDGRTYVMRFDWNSRTDRWTFGLSTEDGDDILQGAILQVGIDLLRTIPTTLDAAPPGKLFIAGADDPRRIDIESITMFYAPGI